MLPLKVGGRIKKKVTNNIRITNDHMEVLTTGTLSPNTLAFWK